MRSLFKSPRLAAPEKPLFSSEDLKKLLIPLLLEQALAMSIGMADTVMVSSTGEAAVSGVSLVDSINYLLINVFSALATGGAVVVSQYLGKNDREHAGASAKQLFYSVMAISTLIMAVCLALRGPLLKGIFGSIEDSVMASASAYFLLTALSYPFLAWYNASAALLRSEGNAKATLYTSVVMNVINVVGNAVFIFVFHMGAAGAGLATLLSRIAGCFVIQHMLKSPNSLIPYPDLRHFEWRPDLIRKILSVGVPNGLENSLFQLGKLLLLRMVSTFGTVSIAANAVGNSLAGIQVIIGNATGLAMITVVGQCVGAHDYQQARYYTHRLMRFTYLTMGAWNLVMLALNPIVTMPFGLSPEADLLARQIVIIHGTGSVFFWPLAFAFPNALRAAGDARFTMRVSVFSMAVFRIVLGYVFGLYMGMGVIGVWLAMQIDWYYRIFRFVMRFRGNKWEAKALV